MKPKIGDIFIIIIAVSAIILLALSLLNNPINNKTCHIFSQDKEYIYPLNTDQSIEIKGPLGISHVHIKQPGIYVFIPMPTENLH